MIVRNPRRCTARETLRISLVTIGIEGGGSCSALGELEAALQDLFIKLQQRRTKRMAHFDGNRWRDSLYDGENIQSFFLSYKAIILFLCEMIGSYLTNTHWIL